jgi:hypothetical protein
MLWLGGCKVKVDSVGMWIGGGTIDVKVMALLLLRYHLSFNQLFETA